MSSSGSENSSTSGFEDSSNYVSGGGTDDGSGADFNLRDWDDSESSDEASLFSYHKKNDLRAPVVEETRQLGFMRCLVFLLLLVTAVLVSTATYVALNAQEVVTSTSQYSLYSVTVTDASEAHKFTLAEAFSDLVDVIVAEADRTNQIFPYVTLGEEFEVAGRHALADSRAEVAFFMPLVNDVAAWNNYSLSQDWWSDSVNLAVRANWTQHPELFRDNGRNPIYARNETNDVVSIIQDDESEAHLPLWMVSPPLLETKGINLDMLSFSWMNRMSPSLIVLDQPIYSEVLDFSSLSYMSRTPREDLESHLLVLGDQDHSVLDASSLPHSVMLIPVERKTRAGAPTDGELLGVLGVVFAWERFLTNALPDGVIGITAVLENSCGQAFTYQIDGNTPTFIGPGDLHDSFYDSTRKTMSLTDWNSTERASGHCAFQLQIYTASSYWTNSVSLNPRNFTLVVAGTFLLVLLTFGFYDMLVQRRQSKSIQAAQRSHEMIASLFPSNVRERLFHEGPNATKNLVASTSENNRHRAKTVKGFLTTDTASADENRVEMGYEGKPIADLFPDTTVMFADIAGFTAWSSVREPSQVFTLLEALYRSFDETAKRRRVFKVETVGDCYVAVTGLPEPRRDHAVAMARFARECVTAMQVLVKRLEVLLGPDTGDLELRVGLHSGPVTGGVLRGERSRFQLFGDTMTVCSRMESTGIRGKIQISEDTADLLQSAGKDRWIKRRDEKVVAKGKGEMQTYWLAVTKEEEGSDLDNSGHSTNSWHDAADSAVHPDKKQFNADVQSKTNRLVEWNVEVLMRLLKQIEARRRVLTKINPHRVADANEYELSSDDHMVIDEVREIITLPQDNYSDAILRAEEDVTLAPVVGEELTDFVSNIASLYNDSNPFHNFEHASHVTMSVVKLLSRIVAPSDNDFGENGSSLHDHTYGITSDPLTQFSCVLSALIHDVDHQGVPNAQLVAENTHVARQYQGRSPAEQNSLDLAWNLLLDESYSNLRRAIYTTQSGLLRFRQLLVNSVMATDIVDKDLKVVRNAKWERAFSQDHKDENPGDTLNRKATIVIEHLIQASDVSHTMQHWHIYRKWNEKFFEECYKAYVEGRAEKDPSDGWYQGELGFYDFYIIPLAKKLKDCGVFGVASDEYLNYAVRNRREWEERGREVVDEMVEKVKSKTWYVPRAPQESAPKE